MSAFKAFQAGSVMRWHTNPALCHSGDRLDGHSARVARLIMLWHTCPSHALIRAALTHDDGEIVIGDLKGPGKRELSATTIAEIEDVEQKHAISIWGKPQSLDDDEKLWLTFADKTDALMWMLYYSPHQLNKLDWQQQVIKLHKAARYLKCNTQFRIAIAEANYAGDGELQRMSDLLDYDGLEK